MSRVGFASMSKAPPSRFFFCSKNAAPMKVGTFTPASDGFATAAALVALIGV